jgi:hypothetical protein
MGVAFARITALFEEIVYFVQAGEVADEAFPAAFGALAGLGEVAGGEAAIGGNDGGAHGAILVGAGTPKKIFFTPQRETHSLIVYCAKP